MTRSDDSPVRVSLPAQWLRWAPAALLLLAIAGQALAMATVNEDPQAGSGFAMFSSVDFAGSRGVVIEGVADGATVSLEAPPQFGDQLKALRATPTQGRAADLARALHALRWSATAGRATVDGTATFDSISVTIYGLTADGRVLKSRVLAKGHSA